MHIINVYIMCLQIQILWTFFYIFSDKIIKTILIEQNKVRTNVVIVGRAITIEINYKKSYELI